VIDFLALSVYRIIFDHCGSSLRFKLLGIWSSLYNKMSEQATSDAAPPAAEASGETKTDTNQLPPPKEMRSIVLQGYGGLKMVKVVKKPEVKPGEGEVLVRVKAW
jgi:hypothetical protein